MRKQPRTGNILRMAVVAISVFERAPADVVVRLEFDDGQVLEVAGADYYTDGYPFADSFDAWAFLVAQEVPVPLLVQTLDEFDADWEAKVAARRKQNDEDSARARGDAP